MVFTNKLDNVSHDLNSFLTLGTFDGIHLGHQTILRQLIGECRQQSARSILLTFEPHPQTVINPKKIPDIRILTTIDEKKKILESLGLDLLICASFDEQMANLHAEDFIKDVLIDKVGFKKIVIGHDHAFGKNRSGNFETLQRMGQYYNFIVEQIDVVKDHNKIINSTNLRKLLFEGKVEIANRYLGRYYSISGTVIHGDGRGKQIGIPTANLLPEHPLKLIPKTGVYGTYCTVNGVRYKSVTNVGYRPTFTDNIDRPVIETHILNYRTDIYNQSIKLEFVTFLRNEQSFGNADELLKKIQHDIERFASFKDKPFI
jgi:riboflavin kinase / FMN adenylyltransferase